MEEKRWHGVGDNKVVTIPTALTEVTFYVVSSNTSTSDTGTSKYFDNVSAGVIQFAIVADGAIQLVGLNGTDFTDARPITANTNYIEKNCDGCTAIKIKTTAANTQVIVRVR